MNVRWLERARLRPMSLRYMYMSVDWGPQCQNPKGETADILTTSLDLSNSRTAGRRYADRLALLNKGISILAALNRDLRIAEGCSADAEVSSSSLYADLWSLLDRPTRAWLTSDDPMDSIDSWTAGCLSLLDRQANIMAEQAPVRAWSGRMGSDGKVLGAATAVAKCHERIAKLRKGLAS